MGDYILQGNALEARAQGAAFDGRSRRVVDVFGSEAAARAAFRGVNDLSGADELDSAAVRNAIAAAVAQGGGAVRLPAGRAVMNNSDRPDVPIVIPECRPFGAPGVQVNLVGEGAYATVLNWPADAGAHRFAISCGDPRATRANKLGRYASDGFFEGLCSDFQVRGPAKSTAKGASPAAMDGIGWGSRRIMQRVVATGFHSGFSIVGDHTRFENCETRENYAGLRFDEASEFLFGDLTFSKCNFAGDNFAAVSVHGEATLSARFVDRSYLGAPFSIFREKGGSREKIWMADCVFDGVMFEYVGNGFVHEDDASPSGWLQRIRVSNSYFSFRDGPDWSVAGQARLAAFNVGRMWDVKFDNCGWFNLDLGQVTDGAFRMASCQGVALEGDMDSLLARCEQAGKPLLTGLRDPLDALSLELVHRGGSARWRGRLMTAGSDVSKYDLLQRTGAAVEKAAFDADPLTSPLAGISMLGAAANTLCPVAYEGERVPVRTSGEIVEAGPAMVGRELGTISQARGAEAKRRVGWAYATAQTDAAELSFQVS